MIKIEMLGWLGQKFCKECQAEISKVSEILDFLRGNFDDFEEVMKTLSLANISLLITVNGEIVSNPNLRLKPKDKVALIPLYSPHGFFSDVWNGIKGIVNSAVSWVKSLWENSDKKGNEQNYRENDLSDANENDKDSFSSMLSNKYAEGQDVPLVYGELIVGSLTLSKNLRTEYLPAISDTLAQQLKELGNSENLNFVINSENSTFGSVTDASGAFAAYNEARARYEERLSAIKYTRRKNKLVHAFRSVILSPEEIKKRLLSFSAVSDNLYENRESTGGRRWSSDVIDYSQKYYLENRFLSSKCQQIKKIIDKTKAESLSSNVVWQQIKDELQQANINIEEFSDLPSERNTPNHNYRYYLSDWVWRERRKRFSDEDDEDEDYQAHLYFHNVDVQVENIREGLTYYFRTLSIPEALERPQEPETISDEDLEVPVPPETSKYSEEVEQQELLRISNAESRN